METDAADVAAEAVGRSWQTDTNITSYSHYELEQDHDVGVVEVLRFELCVVVECCVRHVSVTFILFGFNVTDRNDHTTVTAPLPVCSAKLSTVGPG
eukprot:scaffold22323_cov164-Skeletonema_dohrnii-CCMP3373.AAC.2